MAENLDKPIPGTIIGSRGVRDIKQTVRTIRFPGVFPVPYAPPSRPHEFKPPALVLFHSPYSIIQFSFDITCEGEAIIPHPDAIYEHQPENKKKRKLFLIHDDITISSIGYTLPASTGVRVPIQRVVGNYYYVSIDEENPLPGAGDKLLQGITAMAVKSMAEEGDVDAMDTMVVNRNDWMNHSYHTRYFIGSIQLGKDNKAGIADLDGVDYPNPDEYGVSSFKDLLSEALTQGGIL